MKEYDEIALDDRLQAKQQENEWKDSLDVWMQENPSPAARMRAADKWIEENPGEFWSLLEQCENERKTLIPS